MRPLLHYALETASRTTAVFVGVFLALLITAIIGRVWLAIEVSRAMQQIDRPFNPKR